MYEVELKLPADHDVVRERLEHAGATTLGTVTQVDTYYDAPDRSFAETDEALRIRREHEGDASTAVLTYKGPLVDDSSKTRMEAETAVEDGDETDAILSGLGYEPAASVRKTRERFALDGWHVTLDAVDDLGEFVEIEREIDELEAGEVPTALREEAEAILSGLGLDAADQIRSSYLGLLLSAGAVPEQSEQ